MERSGCISFGSSQASITSFASGCTWLRPLWLEFERSWRVCGYEGWSWEQGRQDGRWCIEHPSVTRSTLGRCLVHRPSAVSARHTGHFRVRQTSKKRKLYKRRRLRYKRHRLALTNSATSSVASDNTFATQNIIGVATAVSHMPP